MDILFSKSIRSDNDEYLALRDCARNAELRNKCKLLWEKFVPFADRSFAREFALHPYQRFWEMYLGSRLLDLEFEIQKRATERGPDFHLIIENRNVWIEATVPSEGVGYDSVPSPTEINKYEPIPEEKIILRFTNAISEKNKKLSQYIEDGTVQQNDAFIIGICGGKIPLAQYNGTMRSIIKSVYPFGEHSSKIDPMSLEIVENGYRKRTKIIKNSGSQVSTDGFFNPLYSGISGIIYSDTTMTNLPNEPYKEFLYIHNYQANVPMRKGWLKSGKDCWFDENGLFIE